MYSPKLNLIELLFSILKAWVRHRFHELWSHFEGSFGEFLEMAVKKSHCERFAKAHFCHSGNEAYVFEKDTRLGLKCLNAQISSPTKTHRQAT